MRAVRFDPREGLVALSFELAAEDRTPALPVTHTLRVRPRLHARATTP